LYCVRPPFRKGLTFVRQDICTALPERHFDLILCRNVVFTYFSPELQMRLARQLTNRLHPGGALIIGLHEHLPADTEDIELWPNARAVFRRSGVWESAPTELPDEQEWEGT
jgi:chemotaxis protein methyltransferase CheR